MVGDARSKAFSRLLIALWACLAVMLVRAPGSLEAQMGSRMFVFNTLEDLLKGDLWETISQEEVGRYLYVYPEKYQVIGMGTTNWPHRMGEVMVRGKVDNTSFFWANPEYPYRVEKIHEGTFPWIQVALFDPKNSLKWTIPRTQDLHGALIDRMRQDKIRISAIFVEAVTDLVDYSLTYRISKTGLDLSKGEAKESSFRTFRDETRARWIFSGAYVDEEIASSCGSIPGQPLLLTGFNRDTRNGGLIRRSRVQSARVQYHPIESCQVLQSDLIVTDVRVKEKKVSVDVRNAGFLTAEHVKVRFSFPESKHEQEAVLPSLQPQEEVTVRFRFAKTFPDKRVVVEVDPENEILEGNEGNNRYEQRQRLLGW